ncbi:MAG: glycosyltransferase family 9 protein [Bacteroidota bacterium]|nr:hypothetical protein [Candidatus Kapabacteria bacterium]MCS7302100.1 hypothetical protein [Candidatus Kapabacteria bacterium]MDW8074669.1 glycosyltransferase family 9 protein [Bacteroidota bacterium]MDW8270855.1 glycosyltransferase family 9 protein [Bacteroidota bacterium]
MATIAKKIELLIRRAYLQSRMRPFQGMMVITPQRLVLGSRPRILLLRQDRLGDVLCSTPVLQALRAHYPTAQIDMLLSRNNWELAPLVRHWCDRVWRYDKTILSFHRLRCKLQRQQYDVVVDLMDNPSTTSTMFVKGLTAPMKVGVFKQNAWVYTHCVPLLDRARYHYVERIAQLLLPFGIDPATEKLRLHFPVPPAEIQAAAYAIGLDKHPERNRFIFIHLSSRHTTLQWGYKRFEQLIWLLSQNFPDIPIGIGTAPHEREIAIRLAKFDNTFALPELPFLQYAAALSYARMLISPDTAIIHAAAALNVPSVVFFHQHDPTLLPWYPYGSPYRALISRSEQGIKEIPSNAAFDAACELLNGASPLTAERIFVAT